LTANTDAHPEEPSRQACRRARGRNGLGVALRGRARLIAGTAAMAVAFFLIPGQRRTPTRALIAWNVDAWYSLR